MKKIFSERNFAVILFFAALTLFVIAQQDTRKVEKMYMKSGSALSSIIPSGQPPLTQNNREKKSGDISVEE